MTIVKPIGAQTGFQEEGRIRCGHKGPKGQPQGLDTWRFTSPNRSAIEAIARIYGGTPQPWNDPRAKVVDQWEVITEADRVRVWVPPGSLTQWYEKWTGGGCERRCDGVIVRLEVKGPDGPEIREQDCICNTPRRRPGTRAGDELEVWLECVPKTRLTVVLPDIPFGGGWRVETSSAAAMRDMPSMAQVLEMMQSNGLASGWLVVWKDSTKRAGRTQRFQYPRLELDQTPAELAGGAGIAGLPAASVHTAPAELVAASEPVEVLDMDEPPVEVIEVEADEVEAEVVSGGETFVTVADAVRAGHQRSDLEDLGKDTKPRWRVK